MNDNRVRKMRNTVIVAGFVLLTAGLQTGHAANPPDAVRQLLAREDIHSGLCIHLGRSDGRLEAALVNEGLLVHALVNEIALVDATREYLTSKHVYGRASVEHAANLAILPYDPAGGINMIFVHPLWLNWRVFSR